MIEGTNLFLNLFFQALSTAQRSQQNQKQTQALHVRQYSITSERVVGRDAPTSVRQQNLCIARASELMHNPDSDARYA